MKGPTVTARQVAAFRLQRHHLMGGSRATLTQICSDVCGVQAQVMSAAELALWTRRRRVTRDEIRAAVWKDRTLVKTAAMRLTLHLMPAAEFMLHVAALRRSRMAAVYRIMARRQVTPALVTRVNELLMEALSGGPLGQQEAARAAAGRQDREVLARSRLERVPPGHYRGARLLRSAARTRSDARPSGPVAAPTAHLPRGRG